MTLFGFAALLAPVGSDPGRLADGPVPVAVGLFHQCASRSLGTWRMLRPSPRAGISCERANGAEDAAVPFRLDRFVAASDHHDQLGSDVQQGIGVGLAGRSILACADVGHSLCHGSRWVDLLGVAQPNPVVKFRPLGDRNFSACCVIIFYAYAVFVTRRRRKVQIAPEQVFKRVFDEAENYTARRQRLSAADQNLLEMGDICPCVRRTIRIFLFNRP